MQINWFTVIAQLLNFVVLVWLLKRFLYKPILNAIAEREKKIASLLKDAEAKDNKAKKEQAEFSKKNELFDKEKQALMDKVIAETNDERQKLFEAARTEATLLRSKLNAALQEMQENMKNGIAQNTQHEVFAIARKTLADLASLSFEEQATNVFIKRLNELKKEEKKQFIEAFVPLKNGTNPILVRSAFELPENQTKKISKAVNEILGVEAHFQFTTSPELIGGIELTANGYKLAWSISEYMGSLQKNILETLKDKTMKDDTKKTPIEVPLLQQKELPVTAPVTTPINSPVEVPVDKPEEVPIEVPLHNQKEMSVEAPVTTPINSPVEIPVNKPEEVPVQVPKEVPNKNIKSKLKEEPDKESEKK